MLHIRTIMSTDQINKILEAIAETQAALQEHKVTYQVHIQEQKDLDEERLRAHWEVYKQLQNTTQSLQESQDRSQREMNEKIDTLSNSVEPVLKFIQDAGSAKRLGVLGVKITVGISAVLIALGTIGLYTKKFILFIIK